MLKNINIVLLAGILLIPLQFSYADDDNVSNESQNQVMEPRVNFFYDSLSQYGQWIKNDTYGLVWSPNNVSVEWQPYVDDGHWAFTDDGWTWISDLPWGDICFHYGRWFYDDYKGWLWYPDTVWAPSWVAWRSGDDWIGWAPLPPDVIWREDIGFDFDNDSFRRIPHRYYRFCHFHDFTRGHVKDLCAKRADNDDIINKTKITALKTKTVDHRVRNLLPFEDKIKATAGHPITKVEIPKVPARIMPPHHEKPLKTLNEMQVQPYSFPAQKRKLETSSPSKAVSQVNVTQKHVEELKVTQEQKKKEQQVVQKQQVVPVNVPNVTNQPIQMRSSEIKNIKSSTDSKSNPQDKND